MTDFDANRREPVRVAVIDADSALLALPLSVAFVRFLSRHARLSPRLRVSMEVDLLRSQVRRGGSAVDASSQWGAIHSELRGTLVDDLRRWSHRFAESRFGADLVPGMAEELARLRTQGISCVLVTSGPSPLAEALAHRLRVAGGLGTTLESVDGLLTGRVDGSLCAGDARATRLRAQRVEYPGGATLVAAYSGTAEDVPLLTTVHEPVAVNADDELAAIAERHQWRVIRGRRDEARAVRASCASLPFFPI